MRDDAEAKSERSLTPTLTFDESERDGARVSSGAEDEEEATFEA